MTCCAVCGNELPLDAAARCPFCCSPLPSVSSTRVPCDHWHQTVNLELGRPRVTEALSRLERQFVTAREQGCRVLTVIHGYGSSGSGGLIREEVRRRLACWLDERRIVAFLPGEDFSRRGVGPEFWRRYPLLSRHAALGRRNRGITLIFL